MLTVAILSLAAPIFPMAANSSASSTTSATFATVSNRLVSPEQAVHARRLEVEKEVGKCWAYNRDSWKERRVNKKAIQAGVEALKMAQMAYMKEIPGCADKSKESWGNDWPGDTAWTDQFADYKEFKEDRGKGNNGAFGYVANFHGMTVVAFAGTTFGLNQDVLDDLKAVASEDVEWAGAKYKVGGGFMRQFKALQAIGLDDTVKAMAAKTDNKVYCVGHSLGGALANICAVYYANILGAKVMLRTFGSPRVFLTESTKAIQGTLIKDSPSDGVDFPTDMGIITQRWVMFADPVPTLPQCKADFYHIGNGGLDLYDQVDGKDEVGAWGPQHLDYTPYQSGTSIVFTNHYTDSYYTRMMKSMTNAPA